jgi:hypothetical protein
MPPAPPGAGDVILDPAAVHPEFHRLRSLLQARDWTGVRALTDAAEPALRSGLIWTGGAELRKLADEDLLRYVLSRDPDDSTAGAMLGTHLIDAGWEIRSSASARDVSPAQFEAFHEHLRRAEQVLIDAAARNPRDPAVWVGRLTVVRALNLGTSEGHRRMDRLSAAAPHHLAGQEQLLQELCPKWHGSWEQAHGFARACMLAAPPGAHNAVLVADAHIEHWLALPSGEDQAYLRTGPVRAEAHEAAHRSVWHPDFRRTFGWVGAMNTFAMLFSLIGDEPAAASLFTALGPYGSESPWQYLGDPAEQIRAARGRAFAIGRTR